MKTRKAFLEDESNRIRFALYKQYSTPPHNQIENWFSGLTGRVLRRGDFDSVEDLTEKY